MKKYTIGVAGFFGNGVSTAGGQEAKTCSLTRALREAYGKSQVITADTRGWKKKPFRLLCQLIAMAGKCSHVFILPAQNAVRVFVPLFVILKAFCKCKIHYAVVGGWLPEKTAKNKLLSWYAKKLDGIYVETSTMKAALEEQGFGNVTILPNFKFITPLTEKDLPTAFEQPYRLCMFSRVMKEKGVEDAISAVTKINEKYGKTMLKLDVYGKIHPGYKQRFQELMASVPNYIRYAGMVEPEESVQVLKDYFALLFPTYYDGEGFPGTLLDAFASGVPVVASDWKYNSEIIREGYTGTLFPPRDIDALTERLEYIVENIIWWENMRKTCLERAKQYQPHEIIKPIIAYIEDNLE